MNNNLEIEHKLLVDKESFYKLYHMFHEPDFFTQVNVYYDTQHNDVRKMRGSMRIRDIKGEHIFTLKVHTPVGTIEHEKKVKDNSIYSLNDEEITKLLAQFHIQGPFKELTKLKTERAIYNSKEAELCFDISTYNGKKDYEIEYEYKKDHDGFKAFNEILARVGLHFETNCTSKIQRALKSIE